MKRRKMKIQFKSVIIKNFLSYGNAETKFEFNKSPFTVIVGENGTGKSTLIVDALHFALYGKIIRKGIKKEQVYNNINGGKCEVTLYLYVNGVPYIIKRGLKPDYLSLIKDGKEQDERSSKALVQTQIEELIGFDQNTFKNMCILSLNSSKSFVDLTPEETRNVVENLLGIQIYSQMLEKCKSDLKENKDKLKILVKDYDLYDGLVKDNREKLQKANEYKETFEKNKIKTLIDLNKQKTEIEIKKNENEKKIKEWVGVIPNFEQTGYDDKIIGYQTKIDWIQLIINEWILCKYNIENNIKNIRKEDLNYKEEINKLKEKSIFYNDSEKCPICNSKFTLKHKKIECDKIQKEIDRYDSIIELDNRQLQNLNDNLDFFTNEYQNWSKYKKEIENLQKEVCQDKEKKRKEYLKEIENYTSFNNEQSLVINQSRILENDINKYLLRIEIIKEQKMELQDFINEEKVKEYEDKFNTISKSKVETEEELLYLEYMKFLLSDEGFKTNIIKNDLPFLNSSINNYLKDFGVNFGIKFNEQFEIQLTGYSKRGLDYYSLSEGEKKRIDLSILLSFVKLAKKKNSISCNILAIDELLDNALDSIGKENIITLLTNMIKSDIIESVYIISHNRNLILPNFERIEVVKEGEFSKLRREIS
jgi:DNA repair exonuclease SbcCD ATPase subunit